MADASGGKQGDEAAGRTPVGTPAAGPAQTQVAPPAGAPSTPTPPAAPAAAPPPPDGVRETIESIVVAFVLAFLFRAFEAEAFVIPTGSMAPTLYGHHRDVYCTQCGQRFSVGPSDELDTVDSSLQSGQRTHSGFCPNCRFPNHVEHDEIFKGDRILVNKFPYDLHEPERWDVIVFKYPEEPKTNYIKRLVALPGEAVKLEWGDIYTRKIGTDDPWHIARKTPEKQRHLQQLVYDDQHAPRVLEEAGFPPRWAPTIAQNGWTANPQARTYRADSIPGLADQWQWLRYRHLVASAREWERAIKGERLDQIESRPELITDYYAYNARVTIPHVRIRGEDIPGIHEVSEWGQHWVGDLTLNGRLEVFEATGEIQWELVEGSRRYRCRIDLKTGQGALGYIDDLLNKEEEEFLHLADIQTVLKAPGAYTFSWANVDDRLALWINDRLVKSIEFEPGTKFAPPTPPNAPTNRDLSPVGIATRGAKVQVSALSLQRDIYYITGFPPGTLEYETPHTVEELRRQLADPETWYANYTRTRRQRFFELRDAPQNDDDEFLALGDNSPKSRDSRLWAYPSVPRRLLIGKAFFIYWPHAIPFLNDGKGFPVSYYKERRAQGDYVRAIPETPWLSLPFYPQLGRMKRIR